MKISIKKIAGIVLFFTVMLLTFYTVFKGQDIGEVIQDVLEIPFAIVFGCMLLSLGYVIIEGLMIAFLMGGLEKRRSILQYVKYSFIGFFYCAITPSASGGQPMQLYHMKRDGSKFNYSFVVLMVIALLNKLMLTGIGVGIYLFADDILRQYLGSYHTLFLIGLSIDFAWVLILLFLVFFPNVIERICIFAVSLIFKKKKPDKFEDSKVALHSFFDGYRESVTFLRNNKKKVSIVAVFSFLQRISLFFITYFIYKGFGLSGTSLMTILILQASIYVTVDMLPIPGAQGITELMYKTVFGTVFTAETLMPSTYVTRGVYFYFLLIVCGGVVFYLYSREKHKHLKRRRKILERWKKRDNTNEIS